MVKKKTEEVSSTDPRHCPGCGNLPLITQGTEYPEQLVLIHKCAAIGSIFLQDNNKEVIIRQWNVMCREKVTR